MFMGINVRRVDACLPAHAQGITQVETAALHVRQLVLEPLVKMQKRSQQLERIQTAGSLLRALMRMNALAKKLEHQMAAIESARAKHRVRELTKASVTLAEMERLVHVDQAHTDDDDVGDDADDASEDAGRQRSLAQQQPESLFVRLKPVQQNYLPTIQRSVASVLGLAHKTLMDGLRNFNQAQVRACVVCATTIIAGWTRGVAGNAERGEFAGVLTDMP